LKEILSGEAANGNTHGEEKSGAGEMAGVIAGVVADAVARAVADVVV
jgi:hypothetical protein